MCSQVVANRKLQRAARRGERHPKAVLTDSEVALMRRMWAEFPIGHVDHVGYRKLARMFEVSKGTVCDIVSYRRRAQTVAGVRVLEG